MIVYGRITGQTADAWLFQPAFLLDRDPPLGDAVLVSKRCASRDRPLRWARLDALRIHSPQGGGRVQGRVGHQRNFQDLPLFAADRCAVD